MNHLRVGLLVFGVFLLAACSSSQPQARHPEDPYENWNRKVFAVNETLDRWALKPAAQGYRQVTPVWVRNSVGRFFSNLNSLPHFANNLLQAKPEQASRDLGRFFLNSTLGLAGFLDVATPLGLYPSEEDFGQTLGVWGVAQGPYLVWPLLGGQTLTHTLGLPLDYAFNPSTYVHSRETQAGLWALAGLNLRSELLESERLISGDRYSFIRDTYLQRRSFLINDGLMDSDPFMDKNFDDFDFEDAFAD